MRRRLAVGAILVGAIALGGCGGGSTLSKSDYEQKLREDGKKLQAAFGKIQGNPASLDALAKQVGEAQAETKKIADDLDGAKPPKDAAADNDKIVAALRALDKPLGKLKDAAAKGNAALAGQAAQAINRAPELRQASVAAADLEKKGYDIGPLGS